MDVTREDLQRMIEEIVTTVLSRKPDALVCGGGASLNVQIQLNDDSPLVEMLSRAFDEGRVGIFVDEVNARRAVLRAEARQ